MKIEVHASRCTGHARCYAFAPEVYDLDDNGYCDVSQLQVSNELEQAARQGADACPERAIVISE